MILKVRCLFPVGNLLFATKNIQDSSGNWQAKIISISSLSRSIGSNNSYEVSNLSIEFSDTNRFFREMMSSPNRYIVGETIELLNENDVLIYSGAVEKWDFEEAVFKLFITDLSTDIEKVIPTSIISKNDYPDAFNEAIGGAVPIIYGCHEGEKGSIKCFRVDVDAYLVAFHHCEDILKVFDKDGNEITSGWWHENYTDGRCYVFFNAGLGTYDYIFVNIKGKRVEDVYMIDPIPTLKDLISSETTMIIDEVSFNRAQQIMQKRGYQASLAITREIPISEVLTQFSFSFDCDFYIGNNGKLYLSMYDFQGLTPQKVYTNQIANLRIIDDPQKVIERVKYMFDYNENGDYFKYMPTHIIDTKWPGKYEPLDIRYMCEKETAFDVAQRFAIQRKNPERIIHFDVPLDEFAGLDIGSIVEVQNMWAVNPKHIVQINRYNIDFNVDIVQVEGIDVTALSSGMFVLGNRDVLPTFWNFAVGNDRDYGYLADRETGYFSNGTDYGKVLY